MLYKRIAPIGRASGQAEVWRGRDEAGLEVALKYVKVPVAIEDAGSELKRFAREVRCHQQLRHPGIAEILATNLDGEKPFYVMLLADGSLRELLAMHPGGMVESMAVEMILKIMEAVSFAHSNDVLHRDLKPENVLIYRNEPVVADFGLGIRLNSGSTTITVAQVGLGTYQYSAPEQLADSHNVDERADVYSLGAVFYEMLTGTLLFPRPDLAKVPARFRHIVFKATQQHPENRYDSVDSLIVDLQTAMEESEDLLSPLERATARFESIEEGRGGLPDVRAVTRLLLEHSDDDELYRCFVRHASVPMLEEMAEDSPEAFEQIVSALDAFANQSFGWDFTDIVGDALEAAYNVTNRVELRTMLLRRMMLLAAAHHRWHVRNRVADLMLDAMREKTYIHIVADLFRANPGAREFVGERLREHSLPTLVTRALMATAA